MDICLVAGVDQAGASPRRKSAGTDVFSHTLRLEKSPLFQGKKQNVVPCSAHLGSISCRKHSPVLPESLKALSYMVATIASL